MHILTINTGQGRPMPRDVIDAKVFRACTNMVLPTILAGQAASLPWAPGVSVIGKATGGLLRAQAIYHDESRPSMAIATWWTGTEPVDSEAWDGDILPHYQLASRDCPQFPVPHVQCPTTSPWVAVWLELGNMVKHRLALSGRVGEWVSDLEPCLAFAWIDERRKAKVKPHN